MPISGHQSLCTCKASIIVSRDKGGSAQHIANNKNRCDVTHYKVDGVVINDGSSCDFLLMNETTLIAYLIELKGSDLAWAVQQLEATEKKLSSELADYSVFYRIVANKCKTQEIYSTSFKKYREKWKQKLIIKTTKLEENI